MKIGVSLIISIILAITNFFIFFTMQILVKKEYQKTHTSSVGAIAYKIGGSITFNSTFSALLSSLATAYLDKGGA